MSRSMFVGRYQPPHLGHTTLINKVLVEEKGKVVIALRDTPIQESDPYTVGERVEMFKKLYPDAAYYPVDPGWEDADVLICAIPDIKELVYGRAVGWGVRQLKLDDDIEAISATKIRAEMNKDK